MKQDRGRELYSCYFFKVVYKPTLYKMNKNGTGKRL